MLSRQGVNLAFIGMNTKAQTACAEYLRWNHEFKRMDLDTPLTSYLRRMYNLHQRKRIDKSFVRDAYDALYRLDNDIFINYFRQNFEISEGDVVVSNVRYLNELQVLKDLGFTIVRVTSAASPRPRISTYVRGADKDTVFLSMLYDKQFNKRFDVDYSINYTGIARRKDIIVPLLENLGYKFDLATE